MKNIFYIILMISTLFFLQACSADEEVATTAASQTMTDSTGASVSLDGNYVIKCNGTSYGSTHFFNKQEILISGTNYTETFAQFNDTDCDNSTSTSKTVLTFAVGSDTKTSGSDNSSKNGLAVTKIVLAVQSSTLTIHQASLVTSSNTMKMYGYSDWAVDVEKETWGLNEDGTVVEAEVVGYKINAIWHVSGTSLTFGDTEGIDRTKVYPTELDNSKVFKKD